MNKLNYTDANGDTIEEQRRHAWRSGLAMLGDAVLIWVNQGDLAELRIEGRAIYHPIGQPEMIAADIGL